MLLVDKEIVKTPASILFSGARAETPERKLFFLWVKMSESVNKPFLQEFIERFPLLWSISGNLILALWVKDINLLVSNIQVTCENHWLVLIISKFLEVRLKVPIPLVDSVLESVKAITGVRHICFHENEFFELGGNDPAFSVVFGNSKVVGDRERFYLGEDCSS